MLQKKEQSQQQNQAFQQKNIRLKTSASKKIYSFRW